VDFWNETSWSQSILQLVQMEFLTRLGMEKITKRTSRWLVISGDLFPLSDRLSLPLRQSMHPGIIGLFRVSIFPDGKSRNIGMISYSWHPLFIQNLDAYFFSPQNKVITRNNTVIPKKYRVSLPFGSFLFFSSPFLIKFEVALQYSHHAEVNCSNCPSLTH
jgi:hypothetical protein